MAEVMFKDVRKITKSASGNIVSIPKRLEVVGVDSFTPGKYVRLFIYNDKVDIVPVDEKYDIEGEPIMIAIRKITKRGAVSLPPIEKEIFPNNECVMTVYRDKIRLEPVKS